MKAQGTYHSQINYIVPLLRLQKQNKKPRCVNIQFQFIDRIHADVQSNEYTHRPAQQPIYCGISQQICDGLGLALHETKPNPKIHFQSGICGHANLK